MRIEYRRVPLVFGPCGYGILFRRCRAALAWVIFAYDAMGPGVKEALREWKQGTELRERFFVRCRVCVSVGVWRLIRQQLVMRFRYTYRDN
jgi:hypothetical protein